jgi:dihydrofolate reductase
LFHSKYQLKIGFSGKRCPSPQSNLDSPAIVAKIRGDRKMQKLPTPILSAIVAMTVDRVIGANNQLLWHLPADLQHFKKITSGHCILMGRKTYESIGKPLPNRTNIILTRDVKFQAPGCIIIHSLTEFLQHPVLHEKEEVFIIGGAEIYQLLLPQTTYLYVTIVHHHFTGNTYFPEINQTEWQEVERMDYCADANNPYPYSFLKWKRFKHYLL